MKKILIITSLLTAGIALVQPARAQTPPPQVPNPQNQLQQINGPVSQNNTAPASAALQGENPDLAGLEVVNKYPEPKTFTASTTHSLFWTDNAFLLNNSNETAFGYSGQAAVTYVPYSTRDWTPSVTFNYQMISYDRVSSLDFNAMTLRFASKYDLTRDKSWSWTASDSLQQLNSTRMGLGNFYNENFFDNQLTYIRTISSQYNLYFLGAAEVGWRLTDPGYYSRIDNSLLFSLIYAPLPELKVQGYFRPAAYVYTNDQEYDYQDGFFYNSGRTDYNISVGAMATYSPIEQVALNANLNWTGNYSTVGAREYQVFTPTLTVSGAISF